MTAGAFDVPGVTVDPLHVARLSELARLRGELDAAYLLVGILVDRAGGELRITDEELARAGRAHPTRLATYEDPRTLDHVIRRA